MEILNRSRINGSNARARKNGYIGELKVGDWEATLEKYGYKCTSCGEDNIDWLVLDHIIPLSRGGPNTIDNIQPLCIYCNSKKNNYFPGEKRRGGRKKSTDGVVVSSKIPKSNYERLVEYSNLNGGLKMADVLRYVIEFWVTEYEKSEQPLVDVKRWEKAKRRKTGTS